MSDTNAQPFEGQPPSKMDIELEDATLDNDFFDDEPIDQDEQVYDEQTQEDMISTIPIRDDALNLKGVEELSTQQVKSIIQDAVDDPFRIEWIDDHSLNLVFTTSEYALSAIRKLISQEEFQPTSRAEMLTVRNVTPTEEVAEKFPNVVLFVRYATAEDVKVRGAGKLSRYYLFYGDPNHETEEKSRLSDSYVKYLEKISKNPKTRDYLARPATRKESIKKAIDEEYHQLGDLLPGVDTSRQPANKSSRRRADRRNDTEEDLFPGLANQNRRSRRRSKSPDSSSRRWERSRSPPHRSFADLMKHSRPRKRAEDMF